MEAMPVPAVQVPADQETNPWLAAAARFDEAATRLKLDEGMCKVLKAPTREITVNIPADKDMHAMSERIYKAVLEETAASARAAKEELEHGARGEILRRMSTTSVLSLRPSSAGVEVDVRFLARASERTEERNRLYKKLIDLLHV